MLKGFTRNFKPLKILTDEQVETIHRGTMAVLEQTGIKYEDERALKLLAANGCKVDFEEKRVRIPTWLVEDCLRKCPSSFEVKARDPKNNLRIGGNTLYLINSVGMRIVDPDTWESRPATILEQHEGVKVLNALDTNHMMGPYTPYMDIDGVPPVMTQLETDASRLKNSSKASMTAYSNESEIFSIMMARAVGVDFMGVMLASAPLTYYSAAIGAAYRFLETGCPILVQSGSVYGGSAPVTIAGSTITNNTEIIAGIVLLQLIKPGIPVLPSDFTFPMDMKRGQPAFCSLGSSLHQVAFAQIWRSYGLPVELGAPGYPSSKKIDFQGGYEKSLSVLTAALAGANLIEFHGCVSSELTWSPIQAVLDDDVAEWVGRFIEGMKVDHETLALDLIEEVGPIPGNYLNKAHTRKWWRDENFVPKAADYESYSEWLKKGKKDAIALAKDRVNEILSTHQPKALLPGQEEEIDRILGEARKYYSTKGKM